MQIERKRVRLTKFKFKLFDEIVALGLLALPSNYKCIPL